MEKVHHGRVREPDPVQGTVTTNYTFDILNHLIQVSMPRGSNTQTRTFNYVSGSTVTRVLFRVTTPESGTTAYTFRTNHTVATATDAKGQQFSYTYDSLNRVT